MYQTVILHWKWLIYQLLVIQISWNSMERNCEEQLCIYNGRSWRECKAPPKVPLYERTVGDPIAALLFLQKHLKERVNIFLWEKQESKPY